MIRLIRDASIFGSDAEALVNPVNTQGIMGKGLALEFKKRFPECFGPYKEACASGYLQPGHLILVQLLVVPERATKKRPAIILFPTKTRWKANSEIEWIDAGLEYLKLHYLEWGLSSIALPQVGCGSGGLEWNDVYGLINRHFSGEKLRLDVYIGREKLDGKEHLAPASVHHYFAFGSNMDAQQMNRRCPGARLHKVALLPRYKFIINSRGVSSVLPEASSTVHGVLWMISSECEKSLDSYEGVRSGAYRKEHMQFVTADNDSVEALVYVATDSSRGTPRENYLEMIIAAAVSHGLPAEYVEELKSWKVGQNQEKRSG